MKVIETNWDKVNLVYSLYSHEYECECGIVTHQESKEIKNEYVFICVGCGKAIIIGGNK